MNLANKLTIFRIFLVPIMVVIPFFNISGEMFGIPYSIYNNRCNLYNCIYYR